MSPEPEGAGRRRRLLRRLSLGAGVGLGVALLVLAVRGTRPLEVAEARSYDLRTQWLADPAAADSDIVVIAIDEASLRFYRDLLGRWPWPRDVYAAIMEYVGAAGGRLVVFDLLFPEPALPRTALDVPGLGPVPGALGDSLFAESMASTGLGVLAFTLSSGDSADFAAWERSLTAIGGEEALRRGREALEAKALDAAGPDRDGFDFVEPPYPLFAEAARALGAIVWNPDPDGVSRSERLTYVHRGRVYASLPLAAARQLEPERYGGPVDAQRGRLMLGDTRVPLHQGRFLIRWRGPYLAGGAGTYRIIPALRLINSYNQVVAGEVPDVPMEALAGKVVFVAATAPGTFDTRANPLSPDEPGVMIHATILDNLLQGDFMRRARPLASVLLLLATALAAALVSAAAGSAGLGSVLALVVLFLSGAVAVAAFAQGVWVDMAAPLLAGAGAYAGTMASNYMTEGREKRRVRDLFGRYVTPEYVRQLADDFESVELGGERVPLTLLFSDIRGFTSISEKLPAETVIEMLNQYLDRMAEVVFRHGGTLDKFIGDAVMAFWGAPVAVADHAHRAMEAALDMMAELERLNERWSATGAPARLDIGIGINTGEAIVGNIGSLARKLDYTAIGDTVNLASRLEGLNKEYGTNIIVSEFAAAALDDDPYDLRPLDEVRVKGKEQAVRIYELKGRRIPGSAGRVTSALLAGLLTLGAGVGSLAGQESPKERWTDWVYRPGQWQGGSFVEYVTRESVTGTLGLVAKIELYGQAPRWRAEVRKVLDGDSLSAPLVLVNDGEQVVVLTPLGSTPLDQHVAAGDAVVQHLMARMGADGRPVPAPPAWVSTRAEDGTLAFVLLRRPGARTDFPDSMLETGTARRVAGRLARLGIYAIGGERRDDVIASAGARGVATVQTVDGEITLMPDTAAVLRMQGVQVGILELDAFLRDAGIQPIVGTPVPEEGP